MTTDKPKKPETPGMSEVSAKFEPEAEAAWSELWRDWQRCEREEDRASDEEDAAEGALPQWAKEFRRKRAGYEGKPPDTPAARAAAKLDTPAFRAARAGLDAAKQRYSDCGDAVIKVEERILATPSKTVAGVLVKLRIGIRDIILNYSDAEGRMPEESKIGIYCRMVLAALADLENLAGSGIGPDETRMRQAFTTTGRTTIQRLYEQALGVHELAKEAFDLDGGHTSDHIHERFFELRSQIMETPSTGPQDVAIKLRLYAAIDVAGHPETLPEEGDNDHGWLRTAICELERPGWEA